MKRHQKLMRHEGQIELLVLVSVKVQFLAGWNQEQQEWAQARRGKEEENEHLVELEFLHQATGTNKRSGYDLSTAKKQETKREVHYNYDKKKYLLR